MLRVNCQENGDRVCKFFEKQEHRRPAHITADRYLEGKEAARKKRLGVATKKLVPPRERTERSDSCQAAGRATAADAVGTSGETDVDETSGKAEGIGRGAVGNGVSLCRNPVD